MATATPSLDAAWITPGRRSLGGGGGGSVLAALRRPHHHRNTRSRRTPAPIISANISHAGHRKWTNRKLIDTPPRFDRTKISCDDPDDDRDDDRSALMPSSLAVFGRSLEHATSLPRRPPVSKRIRRSAERLHVDGRLLAEVGRHRVALLGGDGLPVVADVLDRWPFL